MADYDTVCVGLSEQTETSRVVFGTIAERVDRAATGNVGVVRGELTDGATGERVIERLRSE